MKKRIYIWGAGEYLKLVFSVLDTSKCEIMGIIDNNSAKQGEYGKTYIYAPSVLNTNVFDYVVISPVKYKEIMLQYIKMGLPDYKVIAFCDEECCRKVDIFLSPLKMSYQIEKYKRHIQNMPYELEVEKIPQIKSAEELLKLVIKHNYSFTRFGDGEFELMLNRERPWFQKPNLVLAKRLKEILVSDSEKVIITIPRNFGSLHVYEEKAAEGIREFMLASVRADIMEYIDLNRIYYDAYVSRPYIIYKDKSKANRIFTLFKKIFEGRDIIIVEGRFSKFGVQNDLLSGCRSIRRIECPSEHAWDKYEEIMDCVKSNYREGDLICLSLGPTATVLAYDLGILGMQAMDIGQLDNEYEWYVKQVDERVDIHGKLVAELKFRLDDTVWLEELKDESYEKQIIAYIGC